MKILSGALDTDSENVFSITPAFFEKRFGTLESGFQFASKISPFVFDAVIDGD